MAADDDKAADGTAETNRILCLTGPESSGKTTLAHALAERFAGCLVPEVARAYLADRGDYSAEDVLEIARLQVAAEAQALESNPSLIVCDTDLLVIRVWWEEKYGALPKELIALLAARQARAYLLVQPDLPWKADPLRENPRDRERLFGVYETLLSADEMPYRTVSGRGEDRLRMAIDAARKLMPALAGSADQSR